MNQWHELLSGGTRPRPPTEESIESFAMLPIALLLGNVTVRLLPSARQALDTEAEGYPGTSFVEAQRELGRKAAWVVPVLLGLGGVAALFSWQHR